MAGDPASSSPAAWGRARLLLPVYLAVLFFNVGENALHVLVPPYLTEVYGLSAGPIGLILAIFGIASLITRFPVGVLYAAERARLLIAIGGTACAGAFLLVPLVADPVAFTVLMAVDGVGWAIATTVLLAVLVARRPAGLTTASAMGWYAGVAGLGHVVAGALGGFLADTYGYHTSFVVLAVVPAAGAAIIVLALERVTATGPPATDSAIPGDGRSGKRRFKLAWRDVRGMPPLVWVGVLAMVYINLISGAVRTFHPVLALAAGLTLTQIGLLASCRSFASAISRLGAGLLFMRGTPARWTPPLVALGAVPLLLLPPVAHVFWSQVPLFLTIGLSRGLLRVSGSAQAFDAAGREDQQHGIVSALVQSGLDVGRIAGPFLAGLIAQAVGVERMFHLLPSALLLTYAALEVVSRRRDVRADS